MADGAIWEVNCANQEDIPAFGVWISKTNRGRVPICFQRNNIIDWTWDGIAEMIQEVEDYWN